MSEPSFYKKWFIAFRPWSFTAAAVPVILGTVWAWSEGYFNAGLFILTLVGGVAIQAGTNLINTYYDFKTGVDTVQSAVTCPVLVRDWLKPESVKNAGIASFVLAVFIGIFLVYMTGWPLLILGIIGIAGGYCYTGGIAYKYKGLGSTLVFFLMGPLMVWGAYYVQTGFHSWTAVLISIPVGFIVSGILHANDLRDIEDDLTAGIATLATATGRDRGLIIHFIIYISAFLSVACFALTGIVPFWACLTIILALPAGIRILKNGIEAVGGNEEKLKMLEMEAAQFHFKFGLLFVSGIIIGAIL